MKNGILLIAVGNPYFGKQAYNLAATIKASEDIPICIVCDDSAMAHLHPVCVKVFDKIIASPLSYSGFEAAMELRTMLPKLTPFQNTLSLDVDMAWLGDHKLPDLFALLDNEDQDITYVNEGYFSMDGEDDDASYGYLPWADPLKIKEAYQLIGKLYQMRGEFILFKKTKRVLNAFKEAQKIRAKPLFVPEKLGGSITEEFALNISFNKNGLAPHINKWPATYWPLMNGGNVPSIRILKENYFGLSTGGNNVSNALKETYNLIVQASCNKIGLPHFYPLQAKRKNIPERLIN